MCSKKPYHYHRPSYMQVRKQNHQKIHYHQPPPNQLSYSMEISHLRMLLNKKQTEIEQSYLVNDQLTQEIEESYVVNNQLNKEIQQSYIANDQLNQLNNVMNDQFVQEIVDLEHCNKKLDKKIRQLTRPYSNSELDAIQKLTQQNSALKSEIKEQKHSIHNLNKKNKELQQNINTNNSMYWQCAIDNNEFAEFSPERNEQLNRLKIGEHFMMKRRKFQYKISKTGACEGIQINIKTKKKRKICKSKVTFETFRLLATKWYTTCRKLSFDDVKSKFYETVSKSVQVVSIKNVQSWKQLGCFEVILKHKCDALKKHRNEVAKYLWHGTNKDAVEPIIKNGFDRSYNNVAAFGNGTYFSNSAEKSIRRKYAPNDDDGYCWLFLCKVIVGRYKKGGSLNDKMIINDDGLEYDSFVNNEKNPSIFAIWRDYAAVPIFLLKLKK